jgi:hypothetical protein
MTPVRIRLLAGLCAAASFARAADAQQPRSVSSWESLAARAPAGTRVTVVRADNTHVDGKIVIIDAAGITIARDDSRYRVSAGDVLRVTRAGVRRDRVLRYGIPIGMIVGGLVTAAVDAGSSHPETGEAFAMGAVLIGLPLGAITAAAIPVGPPLYEAAGTRVAQRRATPSP